MASASRRRVLEWTPSMVGSWLSKHQEFREFATLFVQQDVDGAALIEMGADDIARVIVARPLCQIVHVHV